MTKITMYVVDLEGFGIGDFLTNVEQENDRYIIHSFVDKTADIGEWSDDHPANKTNTLPEQLDLYFES